jgi:hypothetical protein
MPPMNSLGAGPPRQRTINVEVNLLAEWIENRNRLREDRLRWTGLLTTLAFVGIIAVPLLSEYAASSESSAQKAEKLADSRQMTLATLQQQQSLVQPKIDGDATLKLSQYRAKLFMGEILSALNETSPKMAMAMIEGSMIGGELTIRAKAEAENYLAAQEYVASVGKGSNVKSAILTTARPNLSLGPEGVTFEFAKKIEVGK